MQNRSSAAVRQHCHSATDDHRGCPLRGRAARASNTSPGCLPKSWDPLAADLFPHGTAFRRLGFVTWKRRPFSRCGPAGGYDTSLPSRWVPRSFSSPPSPRSPLPSAECLRFFVSRQHAENPHTPCRLSIQSLISAKVHYYYDNSCDDSCSGRSQRPRRPTRASPDDGNGGFSHLNVYYEVGDAPPPSPAALATGPANDKADGNMGLKSTHLSLPACGADWYGPGMHGWRAYVNYACAHDGLCAGINVFYDHMPEAPRGHTGSCSDGCTGECAAALRGCSRANRPSKPLKINVFVGDKSSLPAKVCPVPKLHPMARRCACSHT